MSLGDAEEPRMSRALSSAVRAAAVIALCVLALGQMAGAAPAEATSLRAKAADALRRAVDFYHQKVSSHGGYVYRYSADLTKREGEGKTDADTVWVPRTVSRLLTSAFVVARARRPPVRRDPRLQQKGPSDPLTTCSARGDPVVRS